MAQHFEARMPQQVGDVALGAGVEVVDAQHIVPVAQQAVAQVRAEKARAAGDQHAALVAPVVVRLGVAGVVCVSVVSHAASFLFSMTVANASSQSATKRSMPKRVRAVSRAASPQLRARAGSRSSVCMTPASASGLVST